MAGERPRRFRRGPARAGRAAAQRRGWRGRARRGPRRGRNLGRLRRALRVAVRAAARRALMPTLAIAGGTGFIGSALAHAARARGHAVRVLARHAPAAGRLPAGTEFVQGALDDAPALRRLLADAGWLVHLACQSVPGTALGPAAESDANVRPTLRLLDVLQEFPAARVLFVSTGGALYG